MRINTKYQAAVHGAHVQQHEAKVDLLSQYHDSQTEKKREIMKRTKLLSIIKATRQPA